MKIKSCLLLAVLLLATTKAAWGQFFVVSNNFSGACAIWEYDLNGTYLNTIPLPMADVRGMAASGTNLYAVSWFSGTVGKFTTSGAMINPAIISGLSEPYAITISGTNLFVADSQYVRKYDTSGTLINSQLVATASYTLGMTIIGTNLFVPFASSGKIAEYTFDGTPVNSSLVSGLSGPWGLATDGTDLYVADQGGSGMIDLYNTAGGGGPFIFGISGGPNDLTVLGTNIFAVVNGGSQIARYSTSGALVNASFVTGSGYNNFWGVAALPVAPSTPPPAVGITTYSNQPVVYWPASGGNYVLETTTNLTSGNWVTVSNFVPVTGAIITNATSPAFFRLR